MKSIYRPSILKISLIFLFFLLNIKCSGISYKNNNDKFAITYNNPPVVKLIELSPYISRGGSAVIIFKVEDGDVDSVFIQYKNGEKYFPSPFLKNNYYIGFLSYPLTADSFNAIIIAKDTAGNCSTNFFSIPQKKVIYPKRKIAIRENFSIAKIDELKLDKANLPSSDMEIHNLIMKSFSEKRAIDIKAETSKPRTNFIKKIEINNFKPMKDFRITSPFGERRLFMLKNKVARESYHYGVDLANSKNTEIFTSNDGEVIFAGYNGASGNTIIIHHGLGLYSTYFHCSEIYVKAGENIKAGQLIARSGDTGYALGDHLHFGLIVSGTSVNPEEWMNPEWITNNIISPIQKADSTINKEQN